MGEVAVYKMPKPSNTGKVSDFKIGDRVFVIHGNEYKFLNDPEEMYGAPRDMDMNNLEVVGYNSDDMLEISDGVTRVTVWPYRVSNDRFALAARDAIRNANI